MVHLSWRWPIIALQMTVRWLLFVGGPRPFAESATSTRVGGAEANTHCQDFSLEAPKVRAPPAKPRARPCSLALCSGVPAMR